VFFEPDKLFGVEAYESSDKKNSRRHFLTQYSRHCASNLLNRNYILKIGALAGGGKEVAIGAVAGGGLGGGAQAVTDSQQIKLPSETVLNFTLQAPLTVIPTTQGPDAGRPTLNTQP